MKYLLMQIFQVLQQEQLLQDYTKMEYQYHGTTVIAEIATAGDYINVSFDKLIKICCRGDASLTVQSVPSVLTGTTTPVATTTEIPVIQNANFSIIKKAQG